MSSVLLSRTNVGAARKRHAAAKSRRNTRMRRPPIQLRAKPLDLEKRMSSNCVANAILGPRGGNSCVPSRRRRHLAVTRRARKPKGEPPCVMVSSHTHDGDSFHTIIYIVVMIFRSVASRPINQHDGNTSSRSRCTRGHAHPHCSACLPLHPACIHIDHARRSHAPSALTTHQ